MPQQRCAKAGTETPPKRRAALDRNGLPASTEIACRKLRNLHTAIPELLAVLDLKGAMVTLDAMGCQRAIATRILKRGVDYLVTLKANQGKKFTAVQELCAATCFSRSPPPPAGP